MKTSAFLGLSALFLVACAGAPQRWGSAKPTTVQKPTPTETTVTSAAVSPTNEIAAACKGAGCVSACERTTDMDACREAGYALRDGSSPDFARAARMFDKACTKKDRRACHELGKAFSVGEGIPADANKAVALYGVACDQGLGQACEDLSKLHEKGEGVSQDHTKAVELLARGCVAEDFQMWTCNALKKTATEKKDKLAQKVIADWKKACAAKDATACRGLDRTGSASATPKKK